MAKQAPLHEFEITLERFRFPADLPGRKANFRLIVELRYQNRKGDFDTETALFAASARVTGAGRVVVGNGGDTGYELTFRIAPPGTDSLSGGGV